MKHWLIRLAHARRSVVAIVCIGAALATAVVAGREAGKLRAERAFIRANHVPAVVTSGHVSNLPPGDGLDVGSGGYVGASLTVNTSGQAELFSTKFAAGTAGGNIFIGGGGQSVTGAGAQGSTNTSVGDTSLINVTTGAYLTAVGQDALEQCTSCLDDTCLGQASCLSLTMGIENTCTGVQSCETVTVGNFNTADGIDAFQLGTGDNNTLVGAEAAAKQTTANANTCMGSHSCEQTTTGGNNVAYGDLAMRDNTTGDHNVEIGNNAGGGIVTGHGNTILGGANSFANAGLTEETILGDGDGHIRLAFDANSIMYVGLQVGSNLGTAHVLAVSPHAIAASSGTIGANSNDTAGNITAIGATSVTITFFGGGFVSGSWCVANSNGTPQLIAVTNSATQPTFSCFAPTTGLAANCQDLTYHCFGEQ